MLASRYWPRANVMSFNPLALLVLVSVALLASGAQGSLVSSSVHEMKGSSIRFGKVTGTVQYQNVYAGKYRAYGVSTSGALYVWGRGNEGSTARVWTDSNFGYKATPLEANLALGAPLPPIKSVAAGYEHTVVQTDTIVPINLTVIGWGEGSNRQFGSNTFIRPVSRLDNIRKTQPNAIPKKVVAFPYGTALLYENGFVDAWGSPWIEIDSSNSVPFPIASNEAIGDIWAIEPVVFAKVYRSDRIFYWGEQVPITEMTAPCSVAEIVGGITFYVRCSTGVVYVYPDNNGEPQFTSGTVVGVPSGFTIDTLKPKSPYGIFAEAHHNGTLHLLRIPSSLTQARHTDMFNFEIVPEGSLAPEPITDIAGGADFTLALGASGVIYSWYDSTQESSGSKSAGQFSDISYSELACTASSSCDFRELSDSLVRDKSFQLFESGTQIAIGVTYDNVVWTWASGMDAIVAHDGNGVSWKSVHAGNGVVAAVTSNGELYTAGFYAKGTNFTSQGTLDLTLSPVPALSGVIIHTIALSKSAVTYVTESGDVGSWGLGDGSTGTGSTSSSATGPSDPVSLLTGQTLPIRLYSSGEVSRTWIVTPSTAFVFGVESSCTSFCPYIGCSGTALIPTEVSLGISSVKQIHVATGNSSLFLSVEGTIYTCGSGGLTQFNSGVLAGRNVSMVSGYSKSFVALAGDTVPGEVFVWGENPANILGTFATFSPIYGPTTELKKIDSFTKPTNPLYKRNPVSVKAARSTIFVLGPFVVAGTSLSVTARAKSANITAIGLNTHRDVTARFANSANPLPADISVCDMGTSMTLGTGMESTLSCSSSGFLLNPGTLYASVAIGTDATQWEAVGFVSNSVSFDTSAPVSVAVNAISFDIPVVHLPSTGAAIDVKLLPTGVCTTTVVDFTTVRCTLAERNTLTQGALQASIQYGSEEGASTFVQIGTVTPAPVITATPGVSYAASAKTFVIEGIHFGTNPAQLTVILTHTATSPCNVTSSTGTTIQCTLVGLLEGTYTGALYATVEKGNGGTSGLSAIIGIVTPSPVVDDSVIQTYARNANSLRIYGQNFGSSTTGLIVVVNSGATLVDCKLVAVETTMITCEPQAELGSNSVTVEVKREGASSGVVLIANVVTAPSLSAAAPQSLATNAKTLKIHGSGFAPTSFKRSSLAATQPATTVQLSSGTCEIEQATAAEITCKLGGTLIGPTLSALVTAYDGPAGGFQQVATLVSPPNVTPATTRYSFGTTSLTVFGTGFDGSSVAANSVSLFIGIQETNCSVTAASTTSITCSLTTPLSSQGTLSVAVTSFGGASSQTEIGLVLDDSIGDSTTALAAGVGGGVGAGIVVLGVIILVVLLVRRRKRPAASGKTKKAKAPVAHKKRLSSRRGKNGRNDGDAHDTAVLTTSGMPDDKEDSSSSSDIAPEPSVKSFVPDNPKEIPSPKMVPRNSVKVLPRFESVPRLGSNNKLAPNSATKQDESESTEESDEAEKEEEGEENESVEEDEEAGDREGEDVSESYSESS